MRLVDVRNSVGLQAALVAILSTGCGSMGHLGPGEDCDPDAYECAWHGDSTAFCTDEGLCAMSCLETHDCPDGTVCIRDELFGWDWAYCLPLCSTPSGQQEDCPSDKLGCYELAGEFVCLEDYPSIIY